ncbi:NRDE protein-domain-containing protein [Haematococcus lacustris]
MCIAFFALDPSPGVRFVLCFGRDEYLARPTQAAHWWPDQPHILAGRDEQYGGTWLAASTNGRIAFLTNLREKEADPDQVALEGCHYCTRGELPTRFINSGNSPEAYCQSLEGWRYHGFNLVCVDLVASSMAYANNKESGRSQGLPAVGHSSPPPSATPSSTPPHPWQPSPLAALTPGLPRPSLNTSVAQQGSRLAGGPTAQSHMLSPAEPAWPSSSHTEGGPDSLLPCAKHQRPSTSGASSSSSTRGMQVRGPHHQGNDIACSSCCCNTQM